MKRRFSCFWVIVICFFTLIACASLKGRYPLPAEHPEELNRNPICTECHTTEADTIVYERYDHQTYFGDSHGPIARMDTRTCTMCHRQSFCNECHASRTELKPSIKDQSSNYRRMPHRGDYLTRHRIDGRIDPTSCFRCHGNPKSSKTCVRCHG